MSVLSALLPLVCFLLLLRRDRLPESFLVAALATGAFVALGTEALSLFSALEPDLVLLLWSLYAAALLLRRLGLPAGAPAAPRAGWGGLELSLCALLGAVTGAAGVVALAAAPNNFDSLTYHLPRVMHWIANGSVAHYPTHIDRQLVLAPCSEFFIMHLHLLSGGDRFDNCVQWFAMAGSAVGVSLVARALGGGVATQLTSAAFAVSVPMGLLQASSTQNDYLTGFWAVCLVYFALRSWQAPSFRHSALVGLSLGLAVFTKGTAYLVAAPFALLYLFSLFGRGARRGAAHLALAGALFLAVNAGHYGRNLRLYGNPLSPGTGNDIVSTSYGARPLASALAKSVATQLATGVEPLDRALFAATRALHAALGVDPDAPSLTTASDPFFLQARLHEDVAPNPLHMALMLVCAGLVLALRGRLGQTQLLFTLAAVLSFALLAAAIKWNPFVSRYFLPVFLLSAPFMALTLDAARLSRQAALLAFLLLALSFRVLAQNEMRPLAGSGSVLATPRKEQYFRCRPQARPYFEATARMIRSQPLTRVGILDRDGNMWEYLLWIELGAPSSGYRIEHVNVLNPSGRIGLAGFSTFFPVMI